MYLSFETNYKQCQHVMFLRVFMFCKKKIILWIINCIFNILRNEDVSKIQRNICGQLGFIALDLNKIYHSINSEHFEDMLIDRYLSSINAALMLQPYIRAEKNQMEKILNKTLKVLYYYIIILFSEEKRLW